MKSSKFVVTVIALIALYVSGAIDKLRATVQISEAVTVGSALLSPGIYTVRWTETGSDAQVTFAQGKRAFATVPAQITQGRNGYPNNIIETDTRDNTLTKIALPKQSFSFAINVDISGT